MCCKQERKSDGGRVEGDGWNDVGLDGWEDGEAGWRIIQAFYSRWRTASASSAGCYDGQEQKIMAAVR